MACGPWITRPAELTRRRALLAGAAWVAPAAWAQAQSCDKPLYLTFDTGHMEVAPWVAEVLAGQRADQGRRRQPGHALGAVVEGAGGRGA